MSNQHNLRPNKKDISLEDRFCRNIVTDDDEHLLQFRPNNPSNPSTNPSNMAIPNGNLANSFFADPEIAQTPSDPHSSLSTMNSNPLHPQHPQHSQKSLFTNQNSHPNLMNLDIHDLSTQLRQLNDQIGKKDVQISDLNERIKKLENYNVRLRDEIDMIRKTALMGGAQASQAATPNSAQDDSIVDLNPTIISPNIGDLMQEQTPKLSTQPKMMDFNDFNTGGNLGMGKPSLSSMSNQVNANQMEEFKNISYPPEINCEQPTMYTPNPRDSLKPRDSFDINNFEDNNEANVSSSNANMQIGNIVNMGMTNQRKDSQEIPRYKKSETKNFNIQKWLDDQNHIGPKNQDFYPVKDRIPEICEHKDGSRVIQEQIDIATEKQIAFIFTQAEVKLYELINDQCGNQVIQKFLEHPNEERSKAILTAILPQLIKVCHNSQGSKVVQKSFEAMSLIHRKQLSTEILSNPYSEIDKMIKDQHANHVVQKIIEKGFCDNVVEQRKKYREGDREVLEEVTEHLRKVLENFKSNVYDLCVHALGCRVVQKCIECLPGDVLDHFLQKEIMANVITLAEDKYGNQVIQHILEFGDDNYKNKIVNFVSTNLFDLCNQKYSSNVVQECIKRGSNDHRFKILDMLTKQNPSKVIDLMKHMQGNQVIQTALEQANDIHKSKFIKQVRENKELLKKVRQGKHIISKVDSIIYNNNTSNSGNNYY